MAGASKKKKKPAANPARGFATTSVASKGRVEHVSDASNDANEPNLASTLPTSVESEDVQSTDAAKGTTELELHELSPEALEARLELAELQSIIEAHGPKVQREATRQITRLRTDKRVLRAQAEDLFVKEWLPDELMQQIIELVGSDGLNSLDAISSASPAKSLSDESIISKIWQLDLVLRDIDLSDECRAEALKFVLKAPSLEVSPTSIWGLSEILDWLALSGNEHELLEYDPLRPKTYKHHNGGIADGGKSTIGFPPSFPSSYPFLNPRRCAGRWPRWAGNTIFGSPRPSEASSEWRSERS